VNGLDTDAIPPKNHAAQKFGAIVSEDIKISGTILMAY